MVLLKKQFRVQSLRLDFTILESKKVMIRISDIGNSEARIINCEKKVLDFFLHGRKLFDPSTCQTNERFLSGEI